MKLIPFLVIFALATGTLTQASSFRNIDSDFISGTFSYSVLPGIAVGATSASISGAGVGVIGGAASSVSLTLFGIWLANRLPDPDAADQGIFATLSELKQLVDEARKSLLNGQVVGERLESFLELVDLYDPNQNDDQTILLLANLHFFEVDY